MNSNLACYFSGCGNPVTGQCQGYKERCGRFYCAAHSNSSLCIVHEEKRLAGGRVALQREMEEARQKAIRRAEQEQQAELDRVFREYEASAKHIDLVGEGFDGYDLFYGAFLIGGFALAIYGLQDLFTKNNGWIVLGGILVFALGIGLGTPKWNADEKVRQSEIERISLEKPKFKEFYQEYRLQKAKEANAKANSELKKMLGGLLFAGVVVVGAAGAIAEAHRERRAYDDLHDIADYVRDKQ